MTPVIVRNTVFGEGKPKVCIPIVGKTREEICRAAEEITSLPAELIEWRADWLSVFSGEHTAGRESAKTESAEKEFTEKESAEKEITEVLIKLRRIVGEAMPILFTIRTKNEGGQAEISLSDYCRLNLLAVQGGADFIDVELSAGQSAADELIRAAHSQGKKVILSSHDFSGTPGEEEMLDRLRRMQELNGDISKLAVMPRSAVDVIRLLSVTARMKEAYADRPFITMSMGAQGLVSRLAGESFGSCVTFGCAGTASAPGQMEAETLSRILEAIHQSTTEGRE